MMLDENKQECILSLENKQKLISKLPEEIDKDKFIDLAENALNIAGLICLVLNDQATIEINEEGEPQIISLKYKEVEKMFETSGLTEMVYPPLEN